MVERFLRYSLEHGRKILLMVMDEKGIRRMNATIVALHADTVEYVLNRSGKVKTLSLSEILSASYARGDDGDTLKNERMETKKT